jgi:hypothetical protein
MNEDECCPKFDPIPWDGKLFDWNERKFIKTEMREKIWEKLCSDHRLGHLESQND